jgi:hypothetical protein
MRGSQQVYPRSMADAPLLLLGLFRCFLRGRFGGRLVRGLGSGFLRHGGCGGLGRRLLWRLLRPLLRGCRLLRLRTRGRLLAENQIEVWNSVAANDGTTHLSCSFLVRSGRCSPRIRGQSDLSIPVVARSASDASRVYFSPALSPFCRSRPVAASLQHRTEHVVANGSKHLFCNPSFLVKPARGQLGEGCGNPVCQICNRWYQQVGSKRSMRGSEWPGRSES